MGWPPPYAGPRMPPRLTSEKRVLLCEGTDRTGALWAPHTRGT